MSSLLRPAIVLFLVLTAITGVVYPLAVTGIAQVVFPQQAGGSLIVKSGQIVGSRLIGQSFSDPKYFWSRPSATFQTVIDLSAPPAAACLPSTL